MLKSKSIAVLFLVLVMCTYMISACKANTEDEVELTIGTVEITTEATEDITEETTEVMVEPTTEEIAEETTEEPTTKPELSIHVIDDESLETETKVVEMDEPIELTPQILVDKVVNELTNIAAVGIDYVKTEDSAVIVSFQSDKAPVSNVGSSVEAAILDSISSTLLDNLDYCKKVIFRIEGKAYISGHYEMGLNEAYND